jgi:hypothetical protein
MTGYDPNTAVVAGGEGVKTTENKMNIGPVGPFQKGHIYVESTVSVSSELGPPPPPPQVSVPPRNQRGEAHKPAGEGRGKSQFGRLEKKPSTLSTLWSLQ